MRQDVSPLAIVNIISNIELFGKQNIVFFIACVKLLICARARLRLSPGVGIRICAF